MGEPAVLSCLSLTAATGRCCFPEEADVARRLKEFAANSPTNEKALCELQPADFAEKVINGKVAVDDGDWVQPLFAKVDGAWRLCKLEVLYRLQDARGVPFPAFVDFVAAASDQSPHRNSHLQHTFCSFAVASLLRVDTRLAEWSPRQREALTSVGLLTALNFTSKQLEAAIAAPTQHPELLSLEETEYDEEPEGLTELRCQAWAKFGALSLDDVKPSLTDVEAWMKFGALSLDDVKPSLADAEALQAATAFVHSPPLTPAGNPYKALPAKYNHDFAAARRFISDFRRARREHPEARGELKLAEDFCCYLVGVGHAPFSRESLAGWSGRHPEASAAIRSLGLELMREALDAGLDICLEVSFEDADVEWLHEAIPDLGRRLIKQGGLSGSLALPHSLLEAQLLPSFRLGEAAAPSELLPAGDDDGNPRLPWLPAARSAFRRAAAAAEGLGGEASPRRCLRKPRLRDVRPARPQHEPQQHRQQLPGGAAQRVGAEVGGC